ncbi:aminotransferase class IV [Methylobacterium oryzae CBMB20]
MPAAAGAGPRGHAGASPGRASGSRSAPTLTRGSGPRGLKPRTDPQPDAVRHGGRRAPGPRAFAPLRLWPTAIARNDTSPAARLKTLGYLDAVLAARERRRRGLRRGAVLATRGASSPARGTGNLFALFGATLVTPPLADGVLAPGSRGRKSWRSPTDAASRAEERSLSLPDLLGAEAVLLTNSLRLLAPVAAIGDTAFASAGHPAVTRLRAALQGRGGPRPATWPEDAVA